MDIFIKSSYKDGDSVLNTAVTLNKESGIMDKILNIILSPDFFNVEIRIGDFELDVEHLRTVLK